MLEPGATEVLLAGKPMLIPCARHVVVKAASNAATVNFMVSGDWGKLRVFWLFIKEHLSKNNFAIVIDGDVITFLFCQCPADVDDYRF